MLYNMEKQKSNPMARIWEIAKPEHGRLLLSVILAVLGVVSGIVPFVSAAKIISGLISGNRQKESSVFGLCDLPYSCHGI